MKKILCFVLTLMILCTCVSCAKKPVEVTKDFTAESDTLYVAYIYVGYVGSDGFAGGGNFRDRVYVAYPDADKEFHECNTVRVEFYGRDYKAEAKTITTTLYEDSTYEYECAQTITKVQSARLADYSAGEPLYDKPIVYLYPEEDTVCSVRIDIDGKLTCTYPAYGENGWQGFTAKPDGTLIFADGSEYYALYWEGKGNAEFDMSKGFCVKGSDTADFLKEILPKLGLSAKEANEFIIYWLPRMQENAYNLISFQEEAYTESAKLLIDPAPDTLIRVFMAYKPLDNAVNIEPQEIVTPERSGFTVVEWGGSEIG